MLINVSTSIGQIEQWQNYKDSSGNFSILFPKGDILLKTDTIHAPIGVLEYRNYVFNNKEEKGISVYMVSHVAYPEETIHHDSTELLEDFFLETMDAAAESVYGEVVYKESSEINGYPGYVWRIHYNDEKAVIQTRAFVVDNHYYSLQIVTKRAYSLSPEAEKFFNSFRFLRSPG